jgi:hypothetical protein
MRTYIGAVISVLLISACAASASERNQSATLSDACPVTVPPQPGFVPPAPYPSEPGFGQVWYGTSGLWTNLDANGQVWRDLPVAQDGSVADKTLWFSENLSTADFSSDADIKLTAVDLDGSSPTVVQEGGVPSVNPDIKKFILVGLGLPEPGCWEVTARYQGAELTYVLQVAE